MHSTLTLEGSSISRQNLNDNLDTLHRTPTLFFHLPSFYLKTGCLNPHPLSLTLTVYWMFNMRIEIVYNRINLSSNWKYILPCFSKSIDQVSLLKWKLFHLACIYAASHTFLIKLRHYGLDQLYLRKVPLYLIDCLSNSIIASFIYDVAFKIIL